MPNDKLKHIVQNTAKNKSPSCPDPHKVFLGSAFEDDMQSVISYLGFLEKVGADYSAITWIRDPDSMEKAINRARYYKGVTSTSSKASNDITMPGSLKEIRQFQSFNDILKTYLGAVRGIANIPLLYCIREHSEVSDADQAGRIGDGGLYDDWDEYGIRCLQHSGPHWKHDNSDLWQIISRLIRDGPGWDYIQSCGTSAGKGDGRQAYLQLKGHAYQFSNVQLIVNDAFSKIHALRFDGNAKQFTFENYIR